MGVGARSAAAAPFCLLQVSEVNRGEGRKLTRCKVDPVLMRQGSCVLVNRQDHHQAPTVGPCKTCPHPQREFLEFLQFLCGCVLVQPFSAVHSSFVRQIPFFHRSFGFCSVNLRFSPAYLSSCSVRWSFSPFSRVSIGEIEALPFVRIFDR